MRQNASVLELVDRHGLRGVCRSTYGFKSRHSHHLLSTTKYADVAEWQTR